MPNEVTTGNTENVVDVKTVSLSEAIAETEPKKESEATETVAKPLSDVVEETQSEAEDDDTTDSEDHSEAEKQHKREAFEKRKQSKLLAELKQTQKELQELKKVVLEKSTSNTIEAQIEAAINNIEAKKVFNAKKQEADVILGQQEYMRTGEGQTEFYSMFKADSSLLSIYNIDPVKAVRLADIQFRERKGLSPSKVQTAQSNANKSNLINSGMRTGNAPTFEEKYNDIMNSKVAPAKKAEMAQKLLDEIYRR